MPVLACVLSACVCSQELQHFLFLDSWDDRIGKHRLRHVFRGQTRARAHKLQTSIQRLGDMDHIHTVEPGMVRAFRKYAVPEFSSHGTMRDATVWEWLTVAQVRGAWRVLRVCVLHVTCVCMDARLRLRRVCIAVCVQHHGLPTRLLVRRAAPSCAAACLLACISATHSPCCLASTHAGLDAQPHDCGALRDRPA
jgi:hypothetical protein